MNSGEINCSSWQPEQDAARLLKDAGVTAKVCSNTYLEPIVAPRPPLAHLTSSDFEKNNVELKNR
jgi:hypothetical protein